MPPPVDPPTHVLTGPAYAAQLEAHGVQTDAYGSWRYVVEGDVVRSDPA